MAATNFTPIQLYYSATPAAVPTAPNLVAGELALNTNDGKLYYKNSSSVVTLLASATTVTNSFSAGTTGLTPNTATTGAVTLAGTLAVANGGTGITSFGTGVATALGVNTGSAGAFVVNGGALGSPSTVGTMPAFTLGGTVSGGGNQINNVIIGTSTPLAGAFTSLTASTTLGVTGVSTLTGGAVVQSLTVGLGAGAQANNTAVGASALAANTTGNYGIAIGNQALQANTTGQQNCAAGGYTLVANTTGNYNAGFGTNALLANTTGSSNTAIGTDTLYSNTTASNNTAVGYQSLLSNTTGTLNVALGMNTLRLNGAGTRSTAVGYNALQNYTASGQADNVAVGLNAMNAVASGTLNTAVGNYALGSNATSTGSANSVVGSYALQATTSGSSNAALGFQAGYSLTTGSRNVLIGRNSAFGMSSGSENTVIGPANGSDTGVGAALTSGSVNTLIGINAGITITSGSYNTIVGAYNVPSATTSNAVALADGAGNARFLYLNSTSAEARYASNETMLSYVSANTAGILRHRNIPILGNPNGGTYKGYLILAKAYDGVVGQALSNVLGRFWFVRGGAGSGNRSSIFDVNCATAYSVTTVGISGMDQGDFAQRIVTCTYDSEQWIALETSQTGGVPDGGVFFEGTFQDAGMVYVEATYVSLISEFNSSVGLNVTDFDSTLLLNSGQIQFPATQNASSNANTLDDYEEGNWTATLTSSGGGSATLTTTAKYIKVGNLVFVSVENYSIGISALSAGNLSITGLPFTVSTESPAIAYFQIAGAVTAAQGAVVAYGGGSAITLYLSQSTGVGITNLAKADLNSSISLRFNGTYTV